MQIIRISCSEMVTRARWHNLSGFRHFCHRSNDEHANDDYNCSKRCNERASTHTHRRSKVGVHIESIFSVRFSFLDQAEEEKKTRPRRLNEANDAGKKTKSWINFASEHDYVNKRIWIWWVRKVHTIHSFLSTPSLTNKKRTKSESLFRCDEEKNPTVYGAALSLSLLNRIRKMPTKKKVAQVNFNFPPS